MKSAWWQQLLKPSRQARRRALARKGLLLEVEGLEARALPSSTPTLASPAALGAFQGDATFQAPLISAVQLAPQNMGSLDFNGDGQPDVAVAHANVSQVDVLLSKQDVVHFQLTTPGDATAGQAFGLTVTAVDGSGQVESNYTGTVNLTSADGSATLPAAYTFTAADAGVHTFERVVLDTAGGRWVVATDTDRPLWQGGVVVSVHPGAVTHLSVSAPEAAAVLTSYPVAVSARDAFDNVVTDYAGTVHFTSSDPVAPRPRTTPSAAATRACTLSP